MPGLLVVLAIFGLALTGCETAGLRGDSSGWSPVSAVVVPQASNVSLDETGLLSPLDNTLTVTNPLAFEEGQVIQIEQEQLLITSIRSNDVIVDRGVNGTTATSHPSKSSIFTVGDLFVVFTTTKQGQIEARLDDGSEAPKDKLAYKPAGQSR